MPYPDHAPRTVKAFGKLIKPLRDRARALGYALGVHGTLLRDIDLIACPWTDEAVPARHLAEALRVEAQRFIGDAWNIDAASARNSHYFHEGSPGNKPHGRLCWTFHLGGGPYIDLSVMPRDTTERFMRVNLFAFTAPNPDYPEFISINETDGTISVEVRGPKKAAGAEGNPHPFEMPGNQACMRLPREQLPELIKNLQRALERRPLSVKA